MNIYVTVKPGSNYKERIDKTDDGFIIQTKAPAIDGKANVAAVKILADYFCVSKSQVKLVSGATSQYKRFFIDI
ncbi:MAG: DUF167 domain-containing protein [Candidatus Saccharimonadales bacterium]|jgi:uncharacterized protein YggU (UPF0235/DUF167 family)